MRAATDSVRLGAPATGVPPSQVVSVADPATVGAERMPTNVRSARPTSRDAIHAAILLRASGRIVISPEGLLEDGHTGMGAALDRAARDPKELRRFLGRALADVRELEHGALPLWELRQRFGRPLEEVSHLCVPLGSRLVRRFGDLRLGG